MRYVAACSSVLALALFAPQAGLAQDIVTKGRAAASGVASSGASSSGSELPGRRYGLLIGVNDYDFFSDLAFADADISTLATTLLESGFDARDVTVLRDGLQNRLSLPHRNNILLQLKNLLETVQKNDLVVVAFSGHGVHLKGKSYLCPSDSQLENPDETMVSLDRVYEMLHQCPASQKVLIVDACRNDPTPQGTRAPSGIGETNEFTRSVQQQQPPEGTVLFNSCAPNQYSVEDPEFKSGVFMHFVTEGLRGAADADKDSKVSLFELYRYAEYETKSRVRSTRQLVQTPMLKGELTGVYELAVVGDRPRAAVPQPAELAKPQPTPMPTTPAQPDPADVAGTKAVVSHPLLTQGNQYISEGKYDDAIAALTNLIAVSTENAPLMQAAYKARSSAYRGQGTPAAVGRALVDMQAAGGGSVSVPVRRDGMKLMIGATPKFTLKKNDIVEFSQIKSGYLAGVSVNGNESASGWLHYTALQDPPPPPKPRPQQQYYYDDYDYDYDYDDGGDFDLGDFFDF